MQIKKTISEIIIFVLLVMWVYTFFSKIFDFDTFRRQINGAYILSAGTPILPYILQFLHLALIVMLLAKGWTKIGLMTSFSVLLLYTAYLVYILKFAPSIPCSCIAVFKGMIWQDQLYFNFIALAINIIGLITFFSLKRASHSIQTI